MTDILVVRRVAEGEWQWRYADSRAGWQEDKVHSGDLDALSDRLPRTGTPTYYLVPGEQVVTQQVTAEVRDRRQLNKLVPYQLEEQAIDPVDALHFSLGPVKDGKLAVAYTGLDDLQETIGQLESAGCDVQRCVADFLMLHRDSGAWTLYLEADRLLVHSGEGLGLCVETTLAGAVLPPLLQNRDLPSSLRLCAPSMEQLQTLEALLPESLLSREGLEIERQETGFWPLLDVNGVPELDLRTGALGRRLPLLRWWREWRAPAIATAAAFVLAIAVTLGQYWQAQEEQARIMADMQAVYRQAVPDAGDVVRDPERRLQSLVSGMGGAQASSNLMYLLSEVAPSIAEKEGLNITSFRYGQDNRELQLNLETEDFSLLEALRSDISQSGLTAELLRVSAQGNVHQARMRVVEGSL